jgi:acid phosphatase
MARGNARAAIGAQQGHVRSPRRGPWALLASLAAGASLLAFVPAPGAAPGAAVLGDAGGDFGFVADVERKRRRAASVTAGPRAARPSPKMRFAVIGDLGTGRDKQAQVADKMCAWRQTHPFQHVVTTGDNIYPDGSPDHFERKFYKPYACLLQNGVQFHASLGNHDVHTDNGWPQLQDPAFGMEGRNYVFRKNGVRFVIADSNNLKLGWLKKAARRRPGVRWTIVVFHHPVYSPGIEHGSTPGYRPGLPRLFRKRGVDLVFNGHDHLYAATKPLKGLRYVVTGGGGDKLYGCGKAWFSARCAERYHFVHVVAGTRVISVRAVAPGGVFHRFTTAGLP